MVFNILALKCPHCGDALDGLESDIVFYCTNCGTASEARSNGFRRWELKVLKSGVVSNDDVFYLPFWVFDVSVKVEAPPELVEKASSIMNEYKKVWLPAFRMWRPSYFGNPGMLYTSAQIELEFDKERRPCRLVGGAISPEGAIEMLKPVLLSILDRKLDVAPIEITGQINKLDLCAVPFTTENSKVKDLFVKCEYPFALFQDIPHIFKNRQEK